MPGCLVTWRYPYLKYSPQGVEKAALSSSSHTYAAAVLSFSSQLQLSVTWHCSQLQTLFPALTHTLLKVSLLKVKICSLILKLILIYLYYFLTLILILIIILHNWASREHTITQGGIFIYYAHRDTHTHTAQNYRPGQGLSTVASCSHKIVHFEL